MRVLTSLLKGALQLSEAHAVHVSLLQYSLLPTLPSLVSYSQLRFLNSLSLLGSACAHPPRATVGTPVGSKLDQFRALLICFLFLRDHSFFLPDNSPSETVVSHIWLLDCFRREGMYGPCYSILARSRMFLIY